MNKRILLVEKNREEIHTIKKYFEEIDIEVVQYQTEDLEINIKNGEIKYCNKVIEVNKFDALYVRTYHQMEILVYLATKFKNKPIIGLDPLNSNFQNNKVSDLIKLNDGGIDIPKTYLNVTFNNEKLIKKGHWGYGGFDVSIYDKKGIDRYKEHLQEYIDTNNESDWRVLLINGKAVPFILERFPFENDFRTNIHQGGRSVVHFQEHFLFEKLTQIAEKSGEILGRKYAGVDLRVGKDGTIYVLEVNRTPRLRFFGEPKEIYFRMLQKEVQRVL